MPSPPKQVSQKIGTLKPLLIGGPGVSLPSLQLVVLSPTQSYISGSQAPTSMNVPMQTVSD